MTKEEREAVRRERDRLVRASLPKNTLGRIVFKNTKREAKKGE